MHRIGKLKGKKMFTSPTLMKESSVFSIFHINKKGYASNYRAIKLFHEDHKNI
jgi:hypothetical protein